MNNYITHREYKLPNGRTVTADFDDVGIAKVTIQAMDALFDIINSSDLVEVVRCKDCKYYGHYNEEKEDLLWCQFVDTDIDDYCSEGDRAEE